MRWTEHTARMGRKRNLYRFYTLIGTNDTIFINTKGLLQERNYKSFKEKNNSLYHLVFYVKYILYSNTVKLYSAILLCIHCLHY